MLSHPHLVEAIESLFTPVAIYNNIKGRDAKILARYEEPSWNNPVVRFVDEKGVDLIERRDRVWTPEGIANRMVAALLAAKREVPGYLRLVALAKAGAASGEFLRKASFAMY